MSGRATLAMLVLAAPCVAISQTPAAIIAPGATRPAAGLLLVGFAIEPTMTFNVSYLHRVSGAVSDGRTPNATYVGARLKLPITVVRNDAWRFDLTTATTIGSKQSWAVPATGVVYLAHNRNRAGTMLSVGTEVRTAPGRYGSHGSLGVDLGWQLAWRTLIRHSAETIATFGDRYPRDSAATAGITGPIDGWYGHTANRWRLGLAGTRSIGSRTSLHFATGALVASQRQGVIVGFDLGQLPFYLEVGTLRDW